MLEIKSIQGKRKQPNLTKLYPTRTEVQTLSKENIIKISIKWSAV